LVVVGVAAFVAVTYAHLYRVKREGRRVARALPREFAVSLAAVVTWPLFGVLGRRYEPAHKGERPVVLLHGYGMTRTVFLALGAALARRGLGPLVGLSYLSLRSVPASAERLARFVSRTLQHEHAEKVDLVCHSLGGLVARYYVECLGGRAHVRRIVTIATPHQGTLLGYVAMGASGLDLRPGSAVLLELAQSPSSVPLTSIYSLADNIVVPPENARLGGLGEEIVFDDLGHAALLSSARVFRAVAACLGRDGEEARPPVGKATLG
jgi:triacylglycerol esterase/lipase EstA (alpha/beta hydrolase family)